jgi:NAD(P)H-quinone oxidoreductase subunit 6
MESFVIDSSFNFIDGLTIFIDLLVVLGTFGIVVLPNILYSAFLLGWVLFCIAGLFLLLNADFIAAAQVLIYVGAINILILFAIMLVNNTNSNGNKITLSSFDQLLPALISSIFFILLSKSFQETKYINILKPIIQSTEFNTKNSNVVQIGLHFFTDFLLQFELISLILLITLIGAVTIARKENFSRQDINILKSLNLLVFPQKTKE